jgi:hypothetical protein
METAGSKKKNAAACFHLFFFFLFVFLQLPVQLLSMEDEAKQLLRDVHPTRLPLTFADISERFQAYTKPLLLVGSGGSAKVRKKQREHAKTYGTFLIKISHQALQVGRIPCEGGFSVFFRPSTAHDHCIFFQHSRRLRTLHVLHLICLLACVTSSLAKTWHLSG